MKQVTRKELRKIIKEEAQKVLDEWGAEKVVDEAFGLGHEAGVGDLEEFRTKITKLYEDWNPPEDNEIATQYKFELGHMLGLHKEGGCG